MLKLIGTRLVAMVPTLVGAGVLVFFVIRLIPGDAIDAMLAGAEGSLDPQVAANLRHLFGLDRPLYEQFWSWLSSLAVGDLGTSIRTRRPVSAELLQAFPVTLELTAGALVVSLLIAIPAGVVSANRRNSWSDLSARLGALVGLSLPSFWLGLLLIYVCAVVLHILPAGGYIAFSQDPVGNLKDAILPVVTLGTALAAITMRQTRSQVLEVLSNDYVRTARAKGLANETVLYRHALRNALIPVITVIGLQLGRLLGGTVIVEQIFSWPGLGQLLLRSITQRDYPMLQGGVLVLAFFFIACNLLVDILYAYLDPRLRHG